MPTSTPSSAPIVSTPFISYLASQISESKHDHDAQAQQDERHREMVISSNTWKRFVLKEDPYDEEEQQVSLADPIHITPSLHTSHNYSSSSDDDMDDDNRGLHDACKRHVYQHGIMARSRRAQQQPLAHRSGRQKISRSVATATSVNAAQAAAVSAAPTASLSPRTIPPHIHPTTHSPRPTTAISRPIARIIPPRPHTSHQTRTQRHYTSWTEAGQKAHTTLHNTSNPSHVNNNINSTINNNTSSADTTSTPSHHSSTPRPHLPRPWRSSSLLEQDDPVTRTRHIHAIHQLNDTLDTMLAAWHIKREEKNKHQEQKRDAVDAANAATLSNTNATLHQLLTSLETRVSEMHVWDVVWRTLTSDPSICPSRPLAHLLDRIRCAYQPMLHDMSQLMTEVRRRLAVDWRHDVMEKQMSSYQHRSQQRCADVVKDLDHEWKESEKMEHELKVMAHEIRMTQHKVDRHDDDRISTTRYDPVTHQMISTEPTHASHEMGTGPGLSIETAVALGVPLTPTEQMAHHLKVLTQHEYEEEDGIHAIVAQGEDVTTSQPDTTSSTTSTTAGSTSTSTSASSSTSTTSSDAHHRALTTLTTRPTFPIYDISSGDILHGSCITNSCYYRLTLDRADVGIWIQLTQVDGGDSENYVELALQHATPPTRRIKQYSTSTHSLRTAILDLRTATMASGDWYIRIIGRGHRYKEWICQVRIHSQLLDYSSTLTSVCDDLAITKEWQKRITDKMVVVDQLMVEMMPVAAPPDPPPRTDVGTQSDPIEEKVITVTETVTNRYELGLVEPMLTCSSPDITSLRQLPRKHMIKLIHQFYTDKTIADAIDDRQQNDRQSMTAFLVDWMKNKYGLVKIAEQYIHELAYSIQRKYLKDTYIHMFSQFVGFQQPYYTPEDGDFYLLAVMSIHKSVIAQKGSSAATSTASALTSQATSAGSSILSFPTRIPLAVCADVVRAVVTDPRHHAWSITFLQLVETELGERTNGGTVHVDTDRFLLMLMEHTKLMRQHYTERLKQMFQLGDTKRAGYLDYSQFITMLRSMVPWFSDVECLIIFYEGCQASGKPDLITLNGFITLGYRFTLLTKPDTADMAQSIHDAQSMIHAYTQARPQSASAHHAATLVPTASASTAHVTPNRIPYPIPTTAYMDKSYTSTSTSTAATRANSSMSMTLPSTRTSDRPMSSSRSSSRHRERTKSIDLTSAAAMTAQVLSSSSTSHDATTPLETISSIKLLRSFWLLIQPLLMDQTYSLQQQIRNTDTIMSASSFPASVNALSEQMRSMAALVEQIHQQALDVVVAKQAKSGMTQDQQEARDANEHVDGDDDDDDAIWNEQSNDGKRAIELEHQCIRGWAALQSLVQKLHDTIIGRPNITHTAPTSRVQTPAPMSGSRSTETSTLTSRPKTSMSISPPKSKHSRPRPPSRVKR